RSRARDKIGHIPCVRGHAGTASDQRDDWGVMTGQLHEAAPATGPGRSDAGTVRRGQRDIDGLILCAEHFGAPYNLLAAALDAQPARLRGITSR
ncbi:MAG TPA: hypothetical protein VFQ68_07425, partial [Streptosporangiaceae bacterium]|nr:hypothetical protein [Streptosporangiaceae bacterium]